MSNHVIKAAASRNLSSRTRKRLFCDVDGASGINPSVSNSIKKRGFSDARNNLAGKMLTPPIPDCQKGPFGTLGARLAAAVAVVGTRRNEGERRESSAPKAERERGRQALPWAWILDGRGPAAVVVTGTATWIRYCARAPIDISEA